MGAAADPTAEHLISFSHEVRRRRDAQIWKGLSKPRHEHLHLATVSSHRLERTSLAWLLTLRFLPSKQASGGAAVRRAALLGQALPKPSEGVPAA